MTGGPQDAGDGLFLTFDSPADALACAVAIQHALAEHRGTHGFAPRVRIGAHASEALHDGGEWHGRGVRAAARIGALASGDEIVVSRATAGAAGRSFRVSPPRTAQLKGFAEPLEVVSVGWA